MRVKLYKNQMILYLLQMLLFLNPLSHFIVNVTEIGSEYVYYMGYICWLVLFGFSMIIFKGKIIKKEFFVAVFLLGFFFIGTYTGKNLFKDVFYEFHIAIFICLAYISVVGVNSNGALSRKDLLKLLNLIVVIGLLACIYAIVFQGNYALQVLRKVNVSLNAWKYTSFFSNRNIYGEYCFLASVATLYVYAETKKMQYIGILGLLGIQIYITNSRAAFICFILLVGLYVYFCSKTKIVLVIALLFSFIVFNQMSGLMDMVAKRMTHTMGAGIDSSMIRVMMWQDVFDKLIKNHALFFGFGQGTIEKFLYPVYKLGSSHNTYVDALFSGGMVYVLVIIRVMVISFRSICSISEKEVKNVFLAGLIGFAVYGLVEAGMTLFCSNILSVTATIMFIFVPRIYKGENDNCGF